MEKFNPTNNEEKKPSVIGGIVKKTLAGAAVAGVAFGAMKGVEKMNEWSDEAEKFEQENPREVIERYRSDVFDIASIKSNPNIPKTTKFYFRSNIHNENGVKWVSLMSSNNGMYTSATANPAIIKFLEENPEEENAFLRKNEKGEMELVRESGEVVMTIE
jgi:hypothetical protein